MNHFKSHLRLLILRCLRPMNLQLLCTGVPIEQVSLSAQTSSIFSPRIIALCRHGSWRRDLNTELVNPFTKSIAHSWGRVFELDLFGPFEAAAVEGINKLLNEVEDSAALGLKDRAKVQGDQCLEEARVALRRTMDIVKKTMNNEQKEASRYMVPHIQEQLMDGYDRAAKEKGPGSVARQKVLFSLSDCPFTHLPYEGGLSGIH